MKKREDWEAEQCHLVTHQFIMGFLRELMAAHIKQMIIQMQEIKQEIYWENKDLEGGDSLGVEERVRRVLDALELERITERGEI